MFTLGACFACWRRSSDSRVRSEANGPERVGELGGGLEAAGAILREALVDDGLELRRAHAARAAEQRRLLREHGEARVDVVVGVERVLAGEELEHDGADRPEVGATVDVLRVAELLGRHVARRAEHREGVGHLLRAVAR